MPKRRSGDHLGLPGDPPDGSEPAAAPGLEGPKGRVLVEPPGYAITSFLSSMGIVVGVGLLPSGLLLAAAAVILSVIEWRRLRAANPWLKLETPEDLRTHEGRVLMRYSTWGCGYMAAFSILALVLVNLDPQDERGAERVFGHDTAAIGPGLIAGVMVLTLNYLLKRALAKPPAPTDPVERMGDDQR